MAEKTAEEKNMDFDSEVIIGAIRRLNDKDSKAYKITEYYQELTTGNLDEGGIVLVRTKVLSIEKELSAWAKEHPNTSTTMQPEDNAIILIHDLRKRGFLE